MNIFLCDLHNTFDGSNENRNTVIKQFVDNLQDLMKIKKMEKLYFSFLTSDNLKYLQKSIIELSKHLENTDIYFGNQYCNFIKIVNGEIIENHTISKIDNIIELIKNKEIDNIIYADDSIINQKMTSKILEINYNLNLISLIPNTHKEMFDDNRYTSDKTGINGLNESLEKYIKVLKKDNIKKLK